MKEKKARVEDALHATRAAVEEGIVPGGGVALHPRAVGAGQPQVRRRPAVRRQHHPPRRRGAAAPDRRRTAGVEGSIVVEKVKNGKGAFGFNAATEEYEDLVKAGVIDPTKVVRAALQNAASVAVADADDRGADRRAAEEEGQGGRRWRRRAAKTSAATTSKSRRAPGARRRVSRRAVPSGPPSFCARAKNVDGESRRGAQARAGGVVRARTSRHAVAADARSVRGVGLGDHAAADARRDGDALLRALDGALPDGAARWRRRRSTTYCRTGRGSATTRARATCTRRRATW